MAITFPATLDSLTNPSSTNNLNNPSHTDQHSNANDAIEALEAKVGVNSSAVATSHDYILKTKDGGVASLDGEETLTNKTIDGDDNTVQDLPYSSIKSTSRSGSDTTLITGTKGSENDVGVWNADGDLVGATTLSGLTLTAPVITAILNESPLASAALADDTATSFSMPKAEGLVLVWQLGNAADGCLVVYRQTAAACNILFNGASSNWQATTGVLTGTTGTDTKYTISAHTDGKIYIENRRGSTQYISAMVIGDN